MAKFPTDTLRQIVMDNAKLRDVPLGVPVDRRDIRALAEAVRALAEAVLQLQLTREE